MANKEVMKLWAEALESDEYKQLNGLLEAEISGHKFNCCLGVLCNLYMKHHPEAEAKWERCGFEPDNIGRLAYKFVSPNQSNDYECSVYLPDEVKEWAGFDNTNPSTGPENERRAFVYLNDVQKYTFKEIAAVIRQFEMS